MEIKLKIVEKEPCPPDEKIKVTMETVDIGGRYAGKKENETSNNADCRTEKESLSVGSGK